MPSPLAPAFIVTDPEGRQSRYEVVELPFRIGRQSGNDLLIRDARASRNHAQLLQDGGDFTIEDLNSRHGVFVNGERVQRQILQHGDRIEFGFPDSYRLTFELPTPTASQPGAPQPAAELTAVIAAPTRAPEIPLLTQTAGEGSLTRLKAVLEVARAIQNSFSLDGVLSAVVDAALVVTQAERGFLLLKRDGQLEVNCARSRSGPLSEGDLHVPRTLIAQALDRRPRPFSMQFDPNAGDPASSAHLLELRSAVAIPLVRIQLGASDSKTAGAFRPDTAGVLYLDSRRDPRDLAEGNTELLETLAIEASTVLENARLIEEDRRRQHINEELAIARQIQQSLLPARLPEDGWLRAEASSEPSRQVGGDYFDLFQPAPDCWAAVIADVAGKGVSSGLVAALLQGAFLTLDGSSAALSQTLAHLNTFFRSRPESRKYATLFCAVMDPTGAARFVNAGHPAPIILSTTGDLELLAPSSPPAGLLDQAMFEVQDFTLKPGDRLILYTDGLTDAHEKSGEHFGLPRLKQVLRSSAALHYTALHAAVIAAINDFTAGEEQLDDRTLVVLEYSPT